MEQLHENSPFQRFPKAMEINRELAKESDRGCCLIIASLLESELQCLINSKLVGNKKFKNELFNFNGPIGTFSAKIKLSFSMGFICKEAYNDLETIRSIRNKFGHSYETLSFDSDLIRNEIKKLKGHFYYPDDNVTNRAIVTNAFTSLISHIWKVEVQHKKFAEMEIAEYYKPEYKEIGRRDAKRYAEFIRNMKTD